MKVYWKYQCDYGHRWEFMREESAAELPEDILCPYGHQAVVLHKAAPIDEVVISILPAGFIADSLKRQISSHGRYWFQLTNIVGGDEQKRSERTYDWLEVVQLAHKFHGFTKDKAWKLWDQLKL